jgi:hypothetical protein
MSESEDAWPPAAGVVAAGGGGAVAFVIGAASVDAWVVEVVDGVEGLVLVAWSGEEQPITRKAESQRAARIVVMVREWSRSLPDSRVIRSKELNVHRRAPVPGLLAQ